MYVSIKNYGVYFKIANISVRYRQALITINIHIQSQTTKYTYTNKLDLWFEKPPQKRKDKKQNR